eukprot:3450332-Rhodomonas_salina.1
MPPRSGVVHEDGARQALHCSAEDFAANRGTLRLYRTHYPSFRPPKLPNELPAECASCPTDPE